MVTFNIVIVLNIILSVFCFSCSTYAKKFLLTLRVISQSLLTNEQLPYYGEEGKSFCSKKNKKNPVLCYQDNPTKLPHLRMCNRFHICSRVQIYFKEVLNTLFLALIHCFFTITLTTSTPGTFTPSCPGQVPAFSAVALFE